MMNAKQFEDDCEKYYRKVHQIILSMTRNATIAQELAQQTMLLFLRIMEKKEIANVGAYLNKIARRLSLAWIRKSRREIPLESEDEEGRQTLEALEGKAVLENDPTSRLLDELETWEQFRDMPWKILLGRLTDEERRLLYMLFVDDLNAEAIAEKLGTDVKRVRRQINRIMAKLRWRARQLRK